MSKHTYRTAVLVLVAAALGAAFYANLAPGLVDAQSKLIEFIKKDQLTNAKTVAINTAGSRLVFITGQTGMDSQMKMSDDIGDQADSALENLGRELTAAGIKRTDVAKLTIYVKNLDLVEGGFVLRSVQTYFDGMNVPVITWVGVTNLVLPDALVEIEAVAVAAN
jgi:enamine deaminase RidA (YjgF/YER057c/UK114 family)